MIQQLSKTAAMLMLPLLIVIISCSSGETEFQNNNPDPDYYLFGLLEDYPALEDSFHNMDQHTFNTLMADGVNVDLDCTVDILPITPDVIDPLTGLLGDARSILGRVIYQDQGDHPDDSYNYYSKDFYAFSDDLAAFSPGTSDDLVSILRKSMGYIQFAHEDEIETVMGDLVSFLSDAQLGSFIMVLQETLGKLMLQANEPMWLDGSGNLVTDSSEVPGITNLNLGDATSGMDSLLAGLRDISSNDEEMRNNLYDIIRELGDVMTGTSGDTEKPFRQVLRELLCNLEDYYTQGGAVHTSNPDYTTNNSNIYVNTELRNAVKELWPAVQKLVIRADREGSIIRDVDGDDSPVDVIAGAFKKLDTIGINLSEYDVTSSINDMMLYDGDGKDRSADGGEYSYLDELVFTLLASNYFGYKDGGDTGEGNYDHGHGESTKGAITVNDCLFSMTSGDTCGMNTYSLCLDDPPGDNVYRSKNYFTSDNRENYKYYMYSSHPANLLLSGQCVGDAAIPNGGVGIGQDDHYTTYWAADSIGIGELNTSRWVLGWIARTCWMGEGPYYYAPDKAGEYPEIVQFDINGDTIPETCNVYYRPDGNVYAYVYKPGDEPAEWQYYYPVDGDYDGDSNSDGERDNRYKEVWYTDYYLIKNKYKYGIGNLGTKTGYFAPGNMGGSEDPIPAERYQITERIPEKSGARECASQEEAMFRNYQWFVNEKKIVYVMPMRIQALSLDFATMFIRIEGNGLQGIANARKGASNGAWCRGNNNNIGDVPAAGRVKVDIKGGLLVKEDMVWDDILGSGYVLPDIIGANFGPVQRMGFLVEDMISSAQAGPDGPYWENRSRLFPVVVAAVGELRKHSHYEVPASGYDFNYSENNRYPFKTITDGLLPALAGPMYYYQKSGTAPVNCWKPRIDTTSVTYLYPDNDDPGDRNDPEFRLKTGLRTLAGFLIENEARSMDGVLPMLTKTDMVKNLLTMLQKMGDSSYDDPDGFDLSNYSTWGMRRKLSYGLEQVLTTIKAGKGESFSSGFSNMSYPEWMFADNKRDVDVSLDALLDEIIGSDDLGKGLAVFVDHREPGHAEYIDGYNWDNYEKIISGLGELMSEDGVTNGDFCITEDLINVLDSTLTSFYATDEELRGLRHTLGSIMTYYDHENSMWMYPSDLTRIINTHLPQIITAYQGHHQNLVFFANTMLMKDGFVEYLLKTLDSRYPAEDVYTQLHAFLGNELVCLPDSPLWCDLNELLISFVDMMIQQNGLKVASTSLFEETVYMPEVAPTAKYDSYNIDPYTALGEILSK